MTTITEKMVDDGAKAAFKVDWPKDNWTRFQPDDHVPTRYRNIAHAAITAALSKLPPAPDREKHFRFTPDELSRYLDKVREAWEAARSSPPDRDAVIETMRTALEDAEQTIDLHVNGASSIDIFLHTLEHIQSALKTNPGNAATAP